MGQKVHPLGFRLGISQDSALACPKDQYGSNLKQNRASLRPVSEMRGYNSNWYSKPKKYSLNLQEDFLIRKYLLEKLQDANLSKIILSRQTEKILVEVHVGQPKIVTGEKGSRLKELTQGLQKTLMSTAKSQTKPNNSWWGETHRDAALNSELPQSGMSDPSDDSFVQMPNKSNVKRTINVRRTIPRISFEVIQITQPATDARLLAKKIAEQLEKRVAFRRVMKQTVQLAREAGINGVKIQIAGRLNGAEIARSEWVREGRVPLHSLNAKMDYAQLGAQTIYGTLGIKVWLFTA